MLIGFIDFNLEMGAGNQKAGATWLAMINCADIEADQWLDSRLWSELG